MALKFPNSNLDKNSLPWAKFVMSKIQDIDSRLRKLDTNHSATANQSSHLTTISTTLNNAYNNAQSATARGRGTVNYPDNDGTGTNNYIHTKVSINLELSRNSVVLVNIYSNINIILSGLSTSKAEYTAGLILDGIDYENPRLGSIANPHGTAASAAFYGPSNLSPALSLSGAYMIPLTSGLHSFKVGSFISVDYASGTPSQITENSLSIFTQVLSGAN